LLALLAILEEAVAVAAVSIRDLDDEVKERLRIRAARNGRSMEAEIRAILADAVSEPNASPGLFVTLLDRFADIGGTELELPPRATPTRAADLST
jgi:plasmid stability protein